MTHQELQTTTLALTPNKTRPELVLEQLGKAFVAGKPVLSGISLNVPAGQFVAIIGKSGCGKSTLLRLIAELDAPTEGQIHFTAQGHDVVPNTRIMFQEPRLLPWEHIIDNVAVGLPNNLPKAQQRVLALDLLKRVGLADRANEWPSVLSGGQKQRVALARALASQPDILALDEPLGALDALTRIEMQQLLENIWQQQKFTAVLVTHDVSEALALADRIILIDDGKIALDIDVPFARPRKRGAIELARLEGTILDTLLHIPVQDTVEETIANVA